MVRILAAASLAGGILVAGAAFPSGSASAQNFNGTCPTVYRRGPIMTAVCLTAFGTFVKSSINVYSCAPGAIANLNGRLGCSIPADGGDEVDYAPPPPPPPAYYGPGPGYGRPGWSGGGYAPGGGYGGGYRGPAPGAQGGYHPPAQQQQFARPSPAPQPTYRAPPAVAHGSPNAAGGFDPNRR